MNNKTTLGYVAMAFVAVLLATVATLPLKYAAAQNATSSQSDESMTESMIKAKIAQLKAEHPVLAGILNNVRSLNATQTLGAIVGIHALERILDAHAINILLHRVAAMRNATGS
jgi:ABC-type phosphate/phosphonate transport system permease subunit